MIVACPQCAARYRVDPSRVGPEGARLRCAKCESVFRVASASPQSAEGAAAPVETPQPQVAAAPSAPAPQQSSLPQEQAAPETLPPPSEAARERMVLVADSDAESAKAAASALTSWGLSPVVVFDGVEAMLSIQRLLPRVVVLDAGLTKMYGFQVCEIVKRNESLRSTKVVLVGTIHHADRYRRPPVELYGADVYLEKPDTPDALLSCLRQFGLPVSTGEVAAEPSVQHAPPQSVQAPPAPPVQREPSFEIGRAHV